MYKKILDGMKNISAEEIDTICLKVSRQLAKEGFPMEHLVDIQMNIIEAVEHRINQLISVVGKAPTPAQMAGLLIEVTIELMLNSISEENNEK